MSEEITAGTPANQAGQSSDTQRVERIERAVRAISGAASQSQDHGVPVPLWAANQALIISALPEELHGEYAAMLSASEAITSETGVPLEAAAMVLGWLGGMLEQSQRVSEADRQAAMMAQLGELVAEATNHAGEAGSDDVPADRRERRNVIGFVEQGYL